VVASRTLVSASALFYALSASAQGSIVGTVYDSLRTRAPLGGATVVVVERARYATTDAYGRFHIDSVPDGHYTVGFMHPVLDSLDLMAPVVTVDVVGGRRTVVTLSTPSRAEAYARICSTAYEKETGLVIGRVRDVDDKSPLADAIVTTDWTEFTLAAGRATGRRMKVVARTSRDGGYLLCGVPTAFGLEVYAELAGFNAGPTPLQLDDRLIGRVDFALSRRDSAARTAALRDSSSASTRRVGTATLRGVVLGGDGRPLRDATIDITGAQRSGRTDGSGAFRIDHIPAGTRTVRLRSLGFEPMTVSMEFATSAIRDTTFLLGRLAQSLTPVDITGRAILPSWMERSGFETRRQQGLGAFLTAQDISRHGYSELSSILQGTRGINVIYGGAGGRGLPFPFLLGVSDFNRMRCVPNVFLDGAPFSIDSGPPRRGPDRERFDVLSSIARPEAIRGIEVYSSGGTIPAQYDLTSSTGCGSIVIWTR
jgi:hypothetical protein